jgi:flagellar biosynthesis protein FlhB
MRIERKGISCLAGVVFATLVALTLVLFFLFSVFFIEQSGAGLVQKITNVTQQQYWEILNNLAPGLNNLIIESAILLFLFVFILGVLAFCSSRR